MCGEERLESDTFLLRGLYNGESSELAMQTLFGQTPVYLGTHSLGLRLRVDHTYQIAQQLSARRSLIEFVLNEDCRSTVACFVVCR